MLVPFNRVPFGLDSAPFAFDQVFSNLLDNTSNPVLRPALDLDQSETGLTLRVELPGVREQDIDLSVHEDLLVLTAERKAESSDESEQNGRKVLRRERHVGRFERRLRLPKAVDAEAVQASLADGVLSVTLPFAAHATPRRIPVLSRAAD